MEVVMIVCDVDGTLVREDGGPHPLLGTLLSEVSALGGEVVVLTARADTTARRAETSRTLDRMGLTVGTVVRLMMRPASRAHEKPGLWKTEALQLLVAGRSQVIVIDDDHEVLKAAFALGCIAVHPALGRRRRT